MPAAETTATSGLRSAKLLQLLFWAGVGLTPLAALLLLVGSGFVLQVAAVLAVLVVLLIGLSIALRREGDSVRSEVEELVYEEMDSLRDDIRGDITHAARATHGQLMERIGALQETVDALRGQVEVLRGQVERAAAQPPPPPPQAGSAAVPPGVLRHTETVQVTTKTMVVDPTEARAGTVYGSRPEIPQQRRPDRSERAPGRPDERAWGRPEQRPEPYPEHYEEHRHDPGRGFERAERVGRSERSERTGWTERSERSEWVERSEPHREQPRDHGREQPREPSWSEQLLRERMDRGGSGDWPGSEPRGGGDWPQPQQPRGDVERGGRRRAYDPDDEDNVTGVRTTDRWASVHSDERGRELRMGERRAAVHADETGTHVRIEDRWATVRHEEYYAEDPRSGGHRDDRDDDGRYDAGRETPRRSAARRERERDWAEREPERGGHARGESRPEPRSETRSESRPESRHGRDDDAGGGHRRADAHWSESSYEQARRDETGATRWSEVRRDRPALSGPQGALPASPAEPASRWSPGLNGLSAPGREEERVGRRRADDEEEYGWNGARDEQRGRAARQIVDFEGTDDRWR